MLYALSMHLFPILPVWAVVLVAGGLLALLAYGCALLRRREVPPRWIRLLGFLRFMIVLVFALCLLQPVLSLPRTVEQRPELLVLVDTSKSMGLAGAAGNGSRLEEVVATLKHGDLVSTLGKRYRQHWFGFDRSAYPVAFDDLPGLQPAGDSTRYAESLTAAVNYLRPGEVAGGTATGTPARLLLASDGNDLSTQDVVETAKRLGVVIDTLAPGAAESSQPREEPTIVDVQCARRVLLGSETQFLVTVRNEDGADHALKLRLLENGKDILSQEVDFARGQTEQRLRLAHRPSEIGMKRFEFHLGNKPEPESGASGAYKISVQVVDNKTEVLILEDSWRWEYKFLSRVFENDPSFTLSALLSRGSGAFVQFGEPDRRVNLGGFPQSRTELNWFDAIILGNVNPKRWPSGLASALSRVVRDDGKSLVVIAGPNLIHVTETPEVLALLPVEITRESARPVEGPIEVHVSQEGASTPFFYNPAAAKNPDPWGSLPPMDQIYPPLRKRPAATVLLESSKKANAYGNLIVMAEHTVGRGRVLFIGTDTLWKWQTLAPAHEAGPTPYTVFWQQALRALAPNRFSSGTVHLWLQPDRSRFEVGQRIGVRAEIQSEQPLLQPRIQATVNLPDGKRLPLAFASDPTEPHLYRAEFEASMPGAHKLAAAVTSEGKTAADVSTLIDVDPSRGELAGTRIDHRNLARIAAATGGKVIDPADPGTWPDSADLPRVSIRQTQTLDLWNNFTLLFILCGLFGVDWLLRLLRGYV